MKITYLFGAGASCQALPIVNQIPQRLQNIIELLRKNEFEFNHVENFNSRTKLQTLEDLISDLAWLQTNSRNHASIDTFAKKLYLKENYAELKRLKIALSIYFVIEQLVNPADKRYDAFFASILNNHYSELPQNIRILSWNYDSQFEKAYAEYTDLPDWDENRTSLRAVTKNSINRPRAIGFCITKLNGSHNILSDNGRRIFRFCPTDKGMCRDAIDEALKNYNLLHDKVQRLSSGISFAWEAEDGDVIEFAKKETEDTDILVVIGYSFPYFNREIDRALIKNMKFLKKVYFQSPEAESLKDRFATIRTDIKELVSIKDVDQFYLPNEL